MRPATRLRRLGLALALVAPLALALALLTDPVAAQPAPASAPAGRPRAAPAPAPASAPADRPRAAPAPAPASAPADVAATEAGFTSIKPGESAAPPDAFTAPDLVKVAYSLIWLVVVVYLVGLWRRNQRLGDEVAALRARFDRQPKADEVQP